MKRTLVILCLVTVFVAGAIVLLEGEVKRDGKGGPTPGSVSKVSGVPVSTMLNINLVASWYSANGEQERIPGSGNAGLYYPRGTATAIYSAGLVWGGQFQDGATPVLRVNGQSYNNGTKPGAILGIRKARNGDFTTVEDPNADDVRIWRIRKDYVTADLGQDAHELGLSVQAVRDQYAKDWAEWPWQKGAPFYDVGYVGASLTDTIGRGNSVLDWGEDVNKNGVLDPGEDVNGNAILDGETPGVADADQVIWYVCNDIGVAQPWTCPESGMEEQATIWGYARTDAIGNTIFKRFRLIYKGTANTPANAKIENMYLCQWSDPDLGDSGDDFTGCDTSLSLGFVYNGAPVDRNYADFGLPPPASGYDFLQGPKVTGVAGEDRNKNGVDDAQDFAIFGLQRTAQGFINLPMTSFIYFAAGGTYTDPPFTYNGALQWYAMLRGLPPTPQPPPDPPPLVNPTTGLATPFWLSGDPVAGTGWIDGSIDQPGDRRLLLTSGPFTMAVGDTQELVSAWVGGLGNSYLGSVSVMKFNDKSVQLAYDNLFSLPKPPLNPNVVISPFNQQLLLDWGADSASVAKTEKIEYIGRYGFEGYKVYQLPSTNAKVADGILIAKYDLVDGIKTISQEVFDAQSGEVLTVPVQFGTDNGIQRSIVITDDKFRGGPLVNGQRYYFAVTAYNYTPDVNKPIRTLESPLQVQVGVPETPKPGTRYPLAAGDSIVAITNVVGAGDPEIKPQVYNPAAQKGLSFDIRFDTTAADTFKWTLTNSSTGKVYFADVTDFGGRTPYAVPEGGLNFFVKLPPVGKVRSIVDGNGNNIFGVTSGAYTVLSADGSMDTLAGKGKTGRDYEIRFDGTGGYAFSVATPAFGSVVIRVPFSTWDVGREGTDTPRRVTPIIRDVAATKTRWNMQPGRLTYNGIQYSVLEPILVSDLTYPATNDSAGVKAQQNALIAVANFATDKNSAVTDLFIAPLNGDTIPPSSGTIVINKFRELRAGDIKRVTQPVVTVGNTDLAKKDIEAIKAFPNPYYGVNRAETDRQNRFITFNHLPGRATLRIFNLAGVLVRTLEKQDAPGAETQYLNWDLHNHRGLPVASGIYIVYIDMPDLGVTKTIKVAIIQEQQFLRNY